MSELPQSAQKLPGIKRPYYPLPVDDPDGLRCVEVQIPNGDEYYELLLTVLQSLTLWYNFARDEAHRGKVIADFFRDAIGLPELGCDMNCEELTACLQPFLDALQQTADQTQQALTDLKQQMETAISGNAAKGISVALVCDDAENIYSGCVALLEKMYQTTKQLYINAEASAVDNAEEMAGAIVALIPELGGLPFAAMLELANSHLGQQQVDFNDDYTQDFIDDAAFDLYCRITNNGCLLTHDIISQWLNNLDTLIPASATATVLARYSIIRQTLLNQIAAFINHNNSLDVYYDELASTFQFAYQAPLALPGGHTCPTDTWTHTITSDDNALRSGSNAGTIDSLGVITGVPTGGDFAGIFGYWTLPADTIVTKMQVTGSVSGITGTVESNAYANLKDYALADIAGSGVALPIVDGGFDISNDNTYSGVRVIDTGWVMGNPSLLMTATIYLEGLGSDPFA